MWRLTNLLGVPFLAAKKLINIFSLLSSYIPLLTWIPKKLRRLLFALVLPLNKLVGVKLQVMSLPNCRGSNKNWPPKLLNLFKASALRKLGYGPDHTLCGAYRPRVGFDRPLAVLVGSGGIGFARYVSLRGIF